MIEVKHLEKRYGDHLAVQDLSFIVEDGQIYGFLGPNGAGKTTTMNIICGYIGATSGEVYVNGKSIADEPLEAKKLIGYLPEQPPLYGEMTAREYLTFAGEIKGVKKEELAAEVARAMKTTGVDEVSERLLKNLSKGFRQRVGLAQAIIGLPPIIILDEPTVGLDPKQIIEIRDLIKELGKNHTVILSSHILSEVSAVCDKVMIISRGRLMASDTPDRLEQMMLGSGALDITVRGERAQVKKIIDALGGCEAEYKETSREGETDFTLRADDGADIREKVFFAFADARLPMLNMARSRASLEEVFLDLTSGEKSAIAAAEQAELEAEADETEEGDE